MTEKQHEKSVHRLQALKQELGKTYEELATALKYADGSYVAKFFNGERDLSKKAAKKLHNICGWRIEYLLGLDDFKTEEDFLMREIPPTKEEVYVNAWNALLHEISEYGGYTFSFKQEKPDYELLCNFSGTSISFEELRYDLLAYAKFYLNQRKEKEIRKQSRNDGKVIGYIDIKAMEENING